MDEFCRENQFVAWFETSAKDNINIDEAANCLINKVNYYIVHYYCYYREGYIDELTFKSKARKILPLLVTVSKLFY